MSVIIKEASYVIVHIPDFVRYGSKPIRDIQENPDVLKEIDSHLRSFEGVINYAPHQVFIGNKNPDELYDIGKPWYEHLLKDGKRNGPFGAYSSDSGQSFLLIPDICSGRNRTLKSERSDAGFF